MMWNRTIGKYTKRSEKEYPSCPSHIMPDARHTVTHKGRHEGPYAIVGCY